MGRHADTVLVLAFAWWWLGGHGSSAITSPSSTPAWRVVRHGRAGHDPGRPHLPGGILVVDRVHRACGAARPPPVAPAAIRDTPVTGTAAVAGTRPRTRPVERRGHDACAALAGLHDQADPVHPGRRPRQRRLQRTSLPATSGWYGRYGPPSNTAEPSQRLPERRPRRARQESGLTCGGPETPARPGTRQNSPICMRAGLPNAAPRAAPNGLRAPESGLSVTLRNEAGLFRAVPATAGRSGRSSSLRRGRSIWTAISRGIAATNEGER